MVSKYKNEQKELKEYKATRIKNGNDKNGKPYTVFTIADSKKIDNNWKSEYYSVFSYQENLKIAEEDKITFDEILAIEVKEAEYQGNKTLKRTIFANVNVIPQNKQSQDIEIVDCPIDDDASGDDLPF